MLKEESMHEEPHPPTQQVQEPNPPKRPRSPSAESANEPAEFDESDDGSERAQSEDTGPLTKAALLTFTDVNAPWISVGEGVVTVEICSEGVSDAPPVNAGGSGKMGKAEPSEIASGLVSHRTGRLVMMDLSEPNEVLLSTPIDVEGLYQVQSDTVLLWEDAQLGRTMAFSFACAEGCEKIMHDITEFQSSELARRNPLEDNVGRNGPTAGGKTGGTAAAAGSPRGADKFAVTVANLPGILDATVSNPLPFGNYVREEMSYFRQLATLFDACKAKDDTNSMERIGQITLNLLGSPFNSDGKILAQFMESAFIDKCVDIVQYALGRRDKASGFISFEERRASFKDPLHLPAALLQKVHLLYSALFIKDLLPLSLDDSDSMSPCMLNVLLLRYKFTIIHEICTRPDLLRRSFELSQHPDESSSWLHSVMALVQDVSRMIKNSPIPLDVKEESYQSMMQEGLFLFCNAVLRRSLDDVEASGKASEADAPPTQGVSSQAPRSSPSQSASSSAPLARSAAATAVEASCDVISNCLFILPTARDELRAECKEKPRDCTLRLVMRCFALMQSSSALQAAYDVVQGAAVGIPAMQLYQASMSAAAQREIIRFWVEGSGVEDPPLFSVAAHIASILVKAGPVSAKDSAEGTAAAAVRPFMWTHGEEEQVVYGFRVLNIIVDKVEDGFRTAFTDALQLSKLLPAISVTMSRHHARRLENVQSSCVSFVTKLVTMGRGNVLKLLESGKETASQEASANSLLSVCMAHFVTCAHRNTILSSVLAALFVNLSTEVHNEKVRVAETVAMGNPLAQPAFITPMEGSNSVSPDTARAHREEAAECRYQKAVAGLMALYGEQLAVRAPALADRLRASLRETPQEAQRAEAETSSLHSTVGRSGEGLSEYDVLAMDFGVDLQASASRSRSRSPSNSPALEAAVVAVGGAVADDSILSSLLDTDSASDSGSRNTEPCEDDDDADGGDKKWSSKIGAAGAVPPPTIEDDDDDSSSGSSGPEGISPIKREDTRPAPAAPAASRVIEREGIEAEKDSGDVPPPAPTMSSEHRVEDSGTSAVGQKHERTADEGVERKATASTAGKVVASVDEEENDVDLVDSTAAPAAKRQKMTKRRC